MAEKVERWEPARKIDCFMGKRGGAYVEFIYLVDSEGHTDPTLESISIRIGARDISLGPDQARELILLLQQELAAPPTPRPLDLSRPTCGSTGCA